MHYNHFRYYDPELGRYITSDPIGLRGGMNTYGYVYQNPVMYYDPDGSIVVLNPLTGAAAGAFGGTYYVTRDFKKAFFAGVKGAAFGLASGFVAGFPGRLAVSVGIALNLLLNAAAGASAEESDGLDLPFWSCLLNPNAPNCPQDDADICQ